MEDENVIDIIEMSEKNSETNKKSINMTADLIKVLKEFLEKMKEINKKLDL